MADRYTKAVLTVIAVALVWLRFQSTWRNPLKVGPKGKVSFRQGVQPVDIVGPVRVFGEVEVSNTVDVYGAVDVDQPVHVTGRAEVDGPVGVCVDNWDEAWLST